MLDFEEELKKFRPSPEIDQVEDNVYKNNLADVTDLLDEMLDRYGEGILSILYGNVTPEQAIKNIEGKDK